MEAGDLEEVAALEKVCFRDPWSLGSFQAELSAAPVSWCSVLRLDEKLAGYMIAWFVEDEAHLANIAVAPWGRRRGYAQRMLDRLFHETYLRGSAILVLEVRASNQGAIQLYERNGFVPGGVRKNYYSRPREDAIVMVRSLRWKGTSE
ncbi:MAG: ribosomal protein S18-alanine N-acetyltransferase [Candidatus Eisenbacteria bacterium]